MKIDQFIHMVKKKTRLLYGLLAVIGFCVFFYTMYSDPRHYPEGASGVSGLVFMAGVALFSAGNVGVLSELNNKEILDLWKVVFGSFLLFGIIGILYFNLADPPVLVPSQPFSALDPIVRFDVIFSFATFTFSSFWVFIATFFNSYFIYFVCIFSFHLIRFFYSLVHFLQMRARPSFNIAEFKRNQASGNLLPQRIMYQFTEAFLASFWLLIVSSYFIPSSFFEIPLVITSVIFMLLFTIALPITVLVVYPLLLFERSGITVDGKVIGPRILHKFWSALAAIAFIGKLLIQEVEISRFLFVLVFYAQIIFGFSIGYANVETKLANKFRMRYLRQISSKKHHWKPIPVKA
ncbi:MAG: hypothetical protein QW279_16030 [Candidatus Jordarchaeaceae archaeon]